MAAVVYVIDTSSLINMRRQCPEDIFPGVWSALARLVKEGRLVTCMEVKAEVERGSDSDLLSWLKRNKAIYRGLDTDQLRTIQEVLAKFTGLVDHNKETADADAFLVALALASNRMNSNSFLPLEFVVVTEESKKRSHIPNACEHYKIRCMRFHDMFREENWKFGPIM
jgi:hypothetical protein